MSQQLILSFVAVKTGSPISKLILCKRATNAVALTKSDMLTGQRRDSGRFHMNFINNRTKLPKCKYA